ncbi:hypothetical protein VSDG_05051 [Cytospora chrysosperma]|uniref:Uncharacterized protein n=1 Tax=Cytospora chrysosperma TaxID=252740 RepID=A0A423VYC2_CYTCH|nr:hypothetical protein VSDG_05051 [Valsa sordida]
MTVSVGVFGPQSRAPTPTYLNEIRSYITNRSAFRCLIEEAASLRDVFSMLSQGNKDVAGLAQGPRYTEYLIQWIANGASEDVASTSSGIVALPRLVIIQMSQYLQFLERQGMTHLEFVDQVRTSKGGIQGYCGGLPAAVAVACARNEQELAEFTCNAIRLAYAIGLYAELGDDSNIPGSTTVVVRLKREGQAEELVKMFPHTYISAITDPKSVSIVGPVKQIADLQAHANQQGLLVQAMDIRGKTHNPENTQLALQLSKICKGSGLFSLPEADQLQVPVRSNKSGDVITHGSLVEELVQTILATRCEWYALLSNVAADLKQTNVEAHRLISFGIGDCVPLMPFNKIGLRVTKSDISGSEFRNKAPDLPTAKEETPDSFSYNNDAIAVIGAACRLPGANNMDELWELISEGIDRHQELKTDRFNLHESYRARETGNFAQNRRFYGNFLDHVDRFDNAFFGINSREMANMDPQQRILLELSYEAMESSGYTRSHVRGNGDPVGCFIGASFVEYLDNTNSHPPTAYTSTGTIRAFLCGRISYYFGWTGPAEVIDTACSSSLVAINRAVKAIRSGECPIALAGGVNIMTGANNFLDLSRAGFLSPTGQCKPFDKDADGYCRAEGAGLIVLKSLKQAEADGDNIIAVIADANTNQGGLSSSITIPDPNAQAQLFRSVIERSGLHPHQVSYVEAHGTGTQAGDPLEVASIRSVFGSPSRARKLHIGSIKGNIGHCETSAGVAGLLKVISMLEHRAIPPQASHRMWNPKIPALAPDKLGISSSLQKWEDPFLAAMVNSYGAAGSNAALLCCEAPIKPVPGTTLLSGEHSSLTLPVIISASSVSSLSGYQSSLASYITKLMATTKNVRLQDVAYTLSEKRRRHKYRAVLCASDMEELVRKLKSADTPICDTASAKPVVLIFGGQSRQTIGLPKVIYERFLTFRTHLDMCDGILRELGYSPILPAVFDTGLIEDIVVLQTAFVSVQYASALTWLKSGIQPRALVGHSLGELTSLAVSGALSIKDCLKLVAARATLMKERWGPDKGSMLAIFASRLDVEQMIAGLKDSSDPNSDLVIACYNSETSQVVSGGSDAVARLESNLSSYSPPVKSLRVETSHGFHSRLVNPVMAELDCISASLTWKEPTIPLELCREQTGSFSFPYSVSGHARGPVFFSDAVTRLCESLGPCNWLEAGFDTPIIPMAKRATSQSVQHDFYGMSTTGENVPSNIISSVVGKLWQSGVDVTHWSFLPSEGINKHIWLPPYNFDPTTAWVDNIDRGAEFQDQLKNYSGTVPAANQLPDTYQRPKPKMVFQIPGSTGPNTLPKVRRFGVSVDCERFSSIVSGHAVRGRPLCPASVYLECVAMALTMLGEKSVDNSALTFEGLDIQSPMGTSTRNVEVVLEEKSTSPHQWAFTVASKSGPASKRATVHANGQVTKNSKPDLEAVSRLVGKQRQALLRSEEVERMLSKRAYALFSRVVTYSDFLKGISSVLMHGNEALASIIIPDNQPGLDDSTVVSCCDAVSMDNLIQVVGLLMNTGDMVSDTEVMVCTGISSSIIHHATDMIKDRSWEVYASYTPTSATQATGDVFAFVRDGGGYKQVAAAFTGCRFTKLDISRLERLLDPVNVAPGGQQGLKPKPGTAMDPIRVTLPSHEVVPPLEFDLDSSSTKSIDSEVDTPASGNERSFLELLEVYTGMPASSVTGDNTLADMGLDSLAATEMAEELQSLYRVSLEGASLLSMTAKEVQQMLYGSAPAMIPDVAKITDRPANPKPDSRSRPSESDFLMQLLVEITGVSAATVQPHMTLEEIGVDSLALTELLSTLSSKSTAPLDTDDISLQSTVKEVLNLIGVEDTGRNSGSDEASDAAVSHQEPSAEALPSGVDSARRQSQAIQTDPRAGLHSCDNYFEAAASRNGFQAYWGHVSAEQDRLVLAYILEALPRLGVDILALREGDEISRLQHHPKHSRLMERLWAILEKHGVIRRDAGRIVRTKHHPGANTALCSDELYGSLVSHHPRYAIEARLMALTGPKLAECLKGDVDPIRLLFGNSSASKILEEYYGSSPMLATLTDQLVSFVTASLPKSSTSTLHILEVGAGTGGTTSRLAKRLAGCGIDVQYTFSDVSTTMVSKARSRFAQQYPWMSFTRLDLEQPPPPDLKNRFDIVIGTNCVHATRDWLAVTSTIRELLNADGFMVLSEVTRIIDWYDLVFGLLDGWWLDSSLSYPLQPAEEWMKVFQKAGFGSVLYSQGDSEDAATQQLLVGCKKVLTGSQITRAVKENGHASQTPGVSTPEKLTVVYKQAGKVPIEADIFLPATPPASPMPIAFMLHGGGYMTLSRKAVRPAQTAYLLANNILPISLDYRLCPEVNVIDGAMTDVRDAFVWARRTLPGIVAGKGVTVDTDSIVVVGWSTGGHLAMSTAWTLQAIGEAPPKAILSFYAPVDFFTRDVFPRQRFGNLPHGFTREQIMEIDLSGDPKTGYDVSGGPENAELGWVKAGDPRSELLLSLFREDSKYGLSLLLNGGTTTKQVVRKLVANEPGLDRVSSICPTFHVKEGTYRTPTFIIHGEKDEVALFESAVQLHEEMKRQGVSTGFLKIRNGRHIHDLSLKPGSERWREQVEPGYQFLFDTLKRKL